MLAGLVALAGGLVALGGLSALTHNISDIPMPAPYREAWVGWSLEVVALVFLLYAILVDRLNDWKTTVQASLAIPTAILVPILDQ